MKHYEDNSFVERYPLSHKKLIKKMWIGICACLLISVYLSFLFFIKPEYFIYVFLSLAFFLVSLLILNYIYQRHYIKTYFYNITDTFLVIRKGVFAPQEITVPFSRINDVYLDQDIFDRLLDIYDVHISTATSTSTVRAHIDGVNKQHAEELRELILNKIKH